MKTKATTTIKRGAMEAIFNCKVVTTNIKAITITKKGAGSCKHEKVTTTKTKATIATKRTIIKRLMQPLQWNNYHDHCDEQVGLTTSMNACKLQWTQDKFKNEWVHNCNDHQNKQTKKKKDQDLWTTKERGIPKLPPTKQTRKDKEIRR